MRKVCWLLQPKKLIPPHLIPWRVIPFDFKIGGVVK